MSLRIATFHSRNTTCQSKHETVNQNTRPVNQTIQIVCQSNQRACQSNQTNHLSIKWRRHILSTIPQPFCLIVPDTRLWLGKIGIYQNRKLLTNRRTSQLVIKHFYKFSSIIFYALFDFMSEISYDVSFQSLISRHLQPLVLQFHMW